MPQAQESRYNMAEKMREMDRKEAVRAEVFNMLDFGAFTQIDTGTFVVETANGFAEVKVVAKNKEYNAESLEEAVDNYARTLADRAAKAEKAEKAKAEKLAKAEAKAKAKE